MMNFNYEDELEYELNFDCISFKSGQKTDFLVSVLNFMVDNHQLLIRDRELHRNVSKEVITLRKSGYFRESKYDVLVDVFEFENFKTQIQNRIISLHGKPRAQKIALITEIFDLILKEYSNWINVADEKFKQNVSTKLFEMREKKKGILHDQKYDILLDDITKEMMRTKNIVGFLKRKLGSLRFKGRSEKEIIVREIFDFILLNLDWFKNPELSRVKLRNVIVAKLSEIRQDNFLNEPKYDVIM
jgi:hypothetical protein